jgi:hypothetical protein
MIKLCFIVACKVYKQYKSYISFYVKKIKEYYPNAMIILVDNNSPYSEYFEQFTSMENVVVIENTSIYKFEIGAYKFATEYIKENNLLYDFYVCTQDTFVLVNKYDFNNLKENHITAASLSHFVFERSFGLHKNILQKLNLYDPSETFLCCWCSSWVVTHENLLKINNILKNINSGSRYNSEECERYMGKILKMLNNNKCYSIEESLEAGYDCKTGVNSLYNVFTIDPTSDYAKELKAYFIKSAQQKNEMTLK